MRLFQKIYDKFKRTETPQETTSKDVLKTYTKNELESYAIRDVYWVTLRRKLKIKNMTEPQREVKSILAIRAGDDLYLDIENGVYYSARCSISDLNEFNVWIASEMPYKFYIMETLMDKHIDYDDKFTSSQLRELIRIQRQKHKTPMYDGSCWGINK